LGITFTGLFRVRRAVCRSASRNVRMAQIKEDLHDQTGDVFREGPLMGCAYILQFICYAIVAIPLIIATFCLLIWVLLAGLNRL